MTCSTRTSLYCCVVKVFRLHHTRRRAGKLPERPELRVERGLKLARNQVLLGKLHDWVERVINERRLDTSGMLGEIHLQWHARKVWGILGRTRGKPAERGRLVAEAEARFARQDLVRPEVVQTVDAAVLQFYECVVKSGATGEMPT